jgi:DNA-binding MarR family transcriptional regulator
MNNLIYSPRRRASGAANGHSHSATAKNAGDLFMKVVRDLLYVDDSTSDLPLRQLRVCTALLDGPRSMSQLSRELRVSLSAMTQIADRLERAGLAARLTSLDDRRVRCLQLTPRGLRAMRTRQDARASRLADVFSRLTPPQRAQVTAALAMLETCLEKNGAVELVS